MPTLKQRQAKAKRAKPEAARVTVDNKSAAEIVAAIARSNADTLAMLNQQAQENKKMITELSKVVAQQQRTIEMLSAKPIQIEQAQQALQMPARAKSFAITYEDDGQGNMRPATLTPDYNRGH